MAQYWCENCTTWVDEGDVTEEYEVVERGDPPATFHYHDYCGDRVNEPPILSPEEEAAQQESPDES